MLWSFKTLETSELWSSTNNMPAVQWMMVTYWQCIAALSREISSKNSNLEVPLKCYSWHCNAFKVCILRDAQISVDITKNTAGHERQLNKKFKLPVHCVIYIMETQILNSDSEHIHIEWKKGFCTQPLNKCTYSDTEEQNLRTSAKGKVRKCKLFTQKML